MKSFQELDLSGLHVLDGGMATELERRGFNLAGPLWSAQVLESSPEAILAVHLDYLHAGADCLLTAGYQASAEGFEEIGRAPEDAENALRASVSLAAEARRQYGTKNSRRIWIGASLGPYGAALHNGAEFHGNYECSFEDLVAFHQRRIAVLATSDADFLAFETIPSLAEANAILTALRKYPGVPASVTFTCRDGSRVAHGEPILDCGVLLEPSAQVIAIGVNCTAPHLIEALIGELGAVEKRIAVYPNSGERWDPLQRCWTGRSDTAEFGKMASLWRARGADWIGGCCRTGPEHIREVAKVWGR